MGSIGGIGKSRQLQKVQPGIPIDLLKAVQLNSGNMSFGDHKLVGWLQIWIKINKELMEWGKISQNPSSGYQMKDSGSHMARDNL